jgi:glycosyltransferase involved in cell wall biosynthesis
MDILMLTPQPFYQYRGSPMRLDNILKELDKRGDTIDLIAYSEGSDLPYKNVTIHRIPDVPFARNIRPGFSWKKLVLDFVMFFKVMAFAFRKRYQLVHAVEESVYMAMLLKALFGVPYIYQMDSSVAQQMVEKYPGLAAFSPVLDFFERLAVRHALVAIPVSDSLSASIEKFEPQKSVVLRDISMLNPVESAPCDDLRARLGIAGPIVMYIGNLESYQGIDLLLESFALALKSGEQCAGLVIIGGEAVGIGKYREKAHRLGIAERTHFLGTKPSEELSDYLYQADIVVSSRIKGKNTPMKLYTYLHSGKALLATNLPTHTEVVDESTAMLAAPSPEAFSEALLRLMRDATLRLELGEAGRQLIEEKYSHGAFRDTVAGLYDWAASKVEPAYIPAQRPAYGARQGYGSPKGYGPAYVPSYSPGANGTANGNGATNGSHADKQIPDGVRTPGGVRLPEGVAAVAEQHQTRDIA